MKNLLFIFLFGCLSCSTQKTGLTELNHINYMTDPSKPKVLGSGSIVEEQREIDGSFEEITVGNGIQLYVLSDNTNSIRIAAQAAILPLIYSEVMDNNLIIRLTASLETAKGIKVYVPIGKLSKITVKEGGYLHFPSSISTLKNIDLLLQSGSLGDCNIDCESFNCTVMGGAMLNLGGKVHQSARIAVKGGSILKGNAFECSKCDITVLGASNCELRVTETLHARVENESSLVYSGNPKVETSSTKLNGKIRHTSF